MTKEDLPPVSDATIDRYNAEDQGSSALAIKSLDDIKRLSMIFIGSGMFKADRSLTEEQQLYQAGVKIIAGVEFGIQPFAAMRGINIIKGNAEMSANLMAAKVKKHPKYDYRVKQWDSDGCVITFFEIPYPGAKRAEWDELGDSSFTLEDAKTAQLAGGDNWRKFARNMFFARAMSNGVRIYTPDVFYGAPVYVEGEISGEFDKSEPEPASEPQKAAAVEGEIVTKEPEDIEIEDAPVAEVNGDAPQADVVEEDDIELEIPEEDSTPEATEDSPVDEADELLGKLKLDINERLEEQGYTKDVQKKAFITKVLKKSVIETSDEADLVWDQLENEAES